MKRLLTSCFGLGWLPVAPGSWGSLPPAIIFSFVYYIGCSWLVALSLMIFLFLAGSVVCLTLSSAAVKATGNKDPGEVVADEIAGQALTFMAMPFLIGTALTGNQICTIMTLGYFLFRLFDTLKVWPSRRLEELPAGWGILVDDWMAGLYACISLVIAAKFWILN